MMNTNDRQAVSGPRCSQNPPGPLDVLGNAFLEISYFDKQLLVTKSSHKLYLYARAVDVSSEIQKVDLHVS